MQMSTKSKILNQEITYPSIVCFIIDFYVKTLHLKIDIFNLESSVNVN